MDLKQFHALLEQSPELVDFDGVIKLIDSLYLFTPTSFQNGQQQNAAGENSGSCKVFAFALKQGFDKQQTLYCFGQYYREVLDNPAGSGHQNIRNFMQTGWDGVSFDSLPLMEREQ